MKNLKVFVFIIVILVTATYTAASNIPLPAEIDIVILDQAEQKNAIGIAEKEIIDFYDLFDVDIDKIIKEYCCGNHFREDVDSRFDCKIFSLEKPDNRFDYKMFYIEKADHGIQCPNLRYFEDIIRERGSSLSEKRANEQLDFYTNTLQFIEKNGMSLENMTMNINLYKDNSLNIAYCINKCKNDSYKLSDLCVIMCIRFRDGYGRDVEVHSW